MIFHYTIYVICAVFPTRLTQRALPACRTDAGVTIDLVITAATVVARLTGTLVYV